MAEGNKLEALECIRKELQPLGVCRGQLHHLTAALMCANLEELRAHVSWSGPSAESRATLLESLHVRCLLRALPVPILQHAPGLAPMKHRQKSSGGWMHMTTVLTRRR